MSDEHAEASEAAHLIADVVAKRLESALSSVSQVTKTIERVNDRLDQVDRRVIHLEAASASPELAMLTKRVDEIAAKVETLGDWRSRVSGAMALFEFVKSAWPVLLVVVVATIAYLRTTGVVK